MNRGKTSLLAASCLLLASMAANATSSSTTHPVRHHHSRAHAHAHHTSLSADDPGLRSSAALVLDETFVTPNTSHQCLETRTAMAYWQNGKVYMHTGTVCAVLCVPVCM